MEMVVAGSTTVSNATGEETIGEMAVVVVVVVDTKTNVDSAETDGIIIMDIIMIINTITANKPIKATGPIRTKIELTTVSQF